MDNIVRQSGILESAALLNNHLHHLETLRQRNKHIIDPQNERRIALLTALAVISFVVLSVSMLKVLIHSFSTWSTSHSQDIDQGMLHAIWKWSITSRLFRDFGEAIVANRPRYLWTQNELFTTYSACIYMVIEGKRHAVPRLWSLFGLAQILPISFAQNLFFVALLDQPIVKRNVTTDRMADVGAMIAYGYLLHVAPQTAGSRLLIYVILGARAILLHPYFTVYQSTRPGVGTTAADLQNVFQGGAAAVMAVSVYQTFTQYSLSEVMTAVFEHPAVSALGCDSVSAAISIAIWNPFGQVNEIGESQKSLAGEDGKGQEVKVVQ